MRIAIVLLILMALISLASRCAAQGPDEFVGPFPSWANVRTLYHARGDGRADDTAALQSALDDLGKPGHSTVLYLPTGTYRITHGLTMKSRINVSMIGEDPARTIIRWDGPAGGVMLDCDGVSYSRFDRVTWDGAGRALTAVMHGWDGHIPYANTEGEHADEVFENVGFGVRGGSKGFMDAECEISRCKFMHCSKAGLSIENFNALDWFVWDSLFEDCARGVTNTFGAGNFHVYRSLFLRSTIADLSIGNTEYFSFRDNVSIGSRAFFIASGIGAACPTTIQGNTIIDPVNPTPIRIGNLGPCLLLDNTIKSRPGKRPVVTFNPSGASPIIIGNRFTVADPILDAAKNPYYLHNRVVSPASIPIPKRRLPEPARRRARPVIEIPAGSTSAAIQKAIDTASRMRGKRPVVHLPAGEYPVNRTLMVPAGSDVQLVGDGFATTLKWSGAGAGPVLQLDGPSRATLRDLSIDGAGTADGIRAISCDQIGGRVYMDQSSVHGGKQNGLLVDSLAHTFVELPTFYHDGSHEAAVKVIGPAQGPAPRVDIYGGASSNSDYSYEVDRGGRLMAQDIWYEGAPPTFMRAGGSGTFTLNGATIAANPKPGAAAVLVDGFKGKLSLLGVILSGPVEVKSGGPDTRLLVVGLGGGGGKPPYFVNDAPLAHAALISSDVYTTGGGAHSIPNKGVASPAFVLGMLAQMREERPIPLGPIRPGATDLRLFRVAVSNTLVGIDVTR